MSSQAAPPTTVFFAAVYCSPRGKLCGESISGAWSEAMVERGSCANRSEDCVRRPAVGVVARFAVEGIRRALAACRRCVEADDSGPARSGNLGRVVDDDGFYLSLSTATAYLVQPGQMFVEALASLLGLTGSLREAIDVALDEAVANAIIHGNLGIGSHDRESADGFIRYCQALDERLADPALADRCIEICAVWDDERIYLHVGDEGAGYECCRPEDGNDALAKTGRGLVIIRAMAVEVALGDGGRSICMTFPRRRPDPSELDGGL